jgi:uncharacterized protein
MGHTRIGILSDTHMPGELKVLWDEVGAAFEGVDLVLHSGDIAHEKILDQCEKWAPVLAARGNHDTEMEDPRMAPMQLLEIEGFRIAMVHDMESEAQPIEWLRHAFLKDEPADIFVAGHTHFELLDYRDSVLQVNSGSPVFPHLMSTRMGTVAVLDLEPGKLRAKVVRIGETPGRPNPGIEFTFDGERVTRVG